MLKGGKSILLESFDGALVQGVVGPDGSPWFNAEDVWRLIYPPDVGQLLSKIDKADRDEFDFGVPEGITVVVSLNGLIEIIRQRLDPGRRSEVPNG